jgi:hypothetical protein
VDHGLTRDSRPCRLNAQSVFFDNRRIKVSNFNLKKKKIKNKKDNMQNFAFSLTTTTTAFSFDIVQTTSLTSKNIEGKIKWRSTAYLFP